MVDNGGIALYSAINGKIGAVACVCDLLVLEYSQGGFNSFRGAASCLQKLHAHLNGSGRVRISSWQDARCCFRDDVRNTGFEMDMLVLVAMEPCSGMDEDCRDVLLLLAESQYAVEGTVSAVRSGSHHGGGGLMLTASAHAFSGPDSCGVGVV